MRPPVSPSLRDFPRSLRVHYGVAPSGYKLSLPIPLRLPHRHLRRAYGVGALRYIVNPETSACFSEPTTPGCCVPSFNRTDATLQATFLPPIEDEAADILTHTATFVYRLRRRATLMPRPRAERTDRRRPMSRAMLSTPPGMWRLPSLRTLPPSVVCVPSHRRPRASLFTATLLSAVNKDRFGLRVDRLRPPACPPLSPDTAPSSRCRARMSAPMVTNYL